MHKLNFKLVLPVVLATALVAGCGGDSSGSAAPAPDSPISQSARSVVDFINSLIAGTSETSDPIEINPLTLAVDDSSDPVPL